MRRIIGFVSSVLLCGLTCLSAFAQSDKDYKIHSYRPNDGGIFMNMSPNGNWGIIQLGSTQGSGSATPKLYNLDTEEAFEVKYGNYVFGVSSVSADGNIVVGSLSGRPAAFNRATNKLTVFPLRNLWQNGNLHSVTPDGKWAVGSYNGYNGKIEDIDELNHDYYYSTLYVNVETGDTISTPGLPRLDKAHLDQHAIVFDQITPDGRYIVGRMSWYIIQPNSGFLFVYDTQEHTYRVVGFTEDNKDEWAPVIPNLYNICDGSLSPDGHWLSGMAYMTEPVEGSHFFREFGVPYRYDMNSCEIEVFTDLDVNVESCVIDNAGTIFANPNNGSPLRDFRVLFQDKYWITMSQICKQYYGFDFQEKTGFERTGTAVAVNGDGSRIASFVDPLGESYIFDFKQPVEKICENIDLLSNYSVSPSNGSIFSLLTSIEINFGRNVQVLGTGRNVHLYKADGTKVADGLSAGNQGLQMKTGSKTIVNAVFRSRQLEAGEKYYVVIDAGAIAVANDASRTNKEIRVNYEGRENGPVKHVSSVPESGTKLRQLDASSYVLLTFDCPVKLTEKAQAYVQRVEDGTVMGALTLSEGNTESTKNQVLLYPASTIYLYDAVDYAVVLEAGSLSDYTGAEVSYNQQIKVPYTGGYVREISNDAVLFSDDFNDPATSYVNWLRYEGDHNTPLASMQNWSFDKDNFPWQFGMSDSNEYSDMYAGSHSLYAPSSESDDWMMTPQISIPEDGNVILQFDAQSYNPDKDDVLKLFVYEDDFVIPYLNDAWMNDDDGIRKNAVLLDEIHLSAGASQEKTSGEWTTYKYDLSKWAGKNVYIAFVNQNYNQSAIFVDNVSVKRELVYTIGFSNVDRVVGEKDITISGQFKVLTQDPVNSISLILKDADDQEVSRVEWPQISGNIKDVALPFAFPQPLPLQLGKENAYSIDITLGERKEVYKGNIYNLTFEPVKRVVLEEMTGIGCPNCPLGIAVIEKCEKTFGDRFIPVSIHTYTGDPYGTGLSGYSDFLGLKAAPSARINRVPGAFSPMVSKEGSLIYTNPDAPLWFDVVAQQLSVMSLADITLSARTSQDGKFINFNSSLRYALDAKDTHLSLLLLVLENGIINYQDNNYGTLDDEILGEWGEGGIYSAATVYPFVHNDVVRSVIGQTFSGTSGLFPSTLEAGKTYTTELSSNWPTSIADVKNATAVAMLVDTQTGEVVNAVRTDILPYDEDAIDVIEDSRKELHNVYNMSGVCVSRNASSASIRHLPAGIYVVDGRKVVIR